MVKLVHEFLTESAAAHPDKTALVCGERRITYAELDRRTNQLAHALVDEGVRRGDRVVVLLPNSIEMAVAVFGTLKAGAVFVPVNSGVKSDKLAYIANNCSAVGLVTNRSGMRVVEPALERFASIRLLVKSEKSESDPSDNGRLRVLSLPKILESSDGSPIHVPMVDQDLACLIYTSGSTGEPKGVVCGHNNVVFASGSIITYLENVPDDILINVLPFSFDYGLYQLLMTLRFGGTLVIENAFAFPAAILRTIERERVTGFPAVPTLVSMLLKLDLSPYDLSSLRYMTNTAAALPPAHIQQLQRLLPHVRIYSMYGMTECKRTLYLPPERLADKPASVGIPIPGTEVWLEDDDGVQVGPGSVGELVVRGSHVMRGYWGDDELTSRFYRSGPTPGERVLRSGDLFRMDDEGLLYFVSRKDDIIKSRGEKVAPKEVEAVICELEGVGEAAVVGVADEVLGQAVKAFVVRNGSAITEREVLRHCSSRLEGFMVPQLVQLVDELPRTSNGKVDKAKLTIS
jgi:amino acid adenylation domain-containing protein